MPYRTVDELPESLRDHLPEHARAIYRAAFNSAWDEYKDPDERRGKDSREEAAHKVAWAAIKRQYEKDERTGDWRAKKGVHGGT